ncbi:hypothetical protein GMD78_13130 [Ornithinibacillus sp. L9]|uniref:Uncharacterized protein n=1 Tax=Ornithinibacillus caprae TaxID=2678566 RepID=A0A6N8FIM3_9BACI|nr:hypothetical protein [Ornithinibacillus caprae]MUK89315.1 hypothetical protein [Ornithinibacillus caprae]
MKEKIYEEVELFIEKNEKVDSSSLYKYIGIGRTVLWRKAPELTAYINERIKIQNDKEKFL